MVCSCMACWELWLHAVRASSRTAHPSLHTRLPLPCLLIMPAVFLMPRLYHPPHHPPRSIQTYLKTRQYSSPPEGRQMPQFDASSYDRA